MASKLSSGTGLVSGTRLVAAFACFLFFIQFNSRAQAQVNEYFDQIAVPSLPAGWTSTRNNTSTPFWVTTAGHPNATPHTPPNVAFSAYPASGVVSDVSLVSPVFQYNGNGTLRFRHKFSMETSWDGGVLEIKIGSAEFQDIITAGGSFVLNGYNGNLNGATPLGTRPAWTGESVGFGNPAIYTTTIVNMPPAAIGQNIQLRWRRGNDSLFNFVGWFIDSIEIGPNESDLQVSKIESIDPVQGGVEFTYTLSVLNNGPALAEQVLVQDAIPQGFNLLGLASITQGTFSSPSPNVAMGNFGLIPAGGSADLVIRVFPFTNISDPGVLTISSPASIARDYSVEALGFSAAPNFPGVSGALKLVTDGVGNINDGCEPLTNAAALQNTIAVIRLSGSCTADIAVSRAQGAGAVAAVVLKPTFDLLEVPSGGIAINIPAVAVHSLDAAVLLPALAGTVQGTVASLPGQMLNAAYASSAIPDPNLSNNIALQYTSFLNDVDFDGVPDVTDNCDLIKNPDQLDADADNIGDLCDTCTDTDADGFGNAEFGLNTCVSDGCPFDAAKIFPGVCGCGVSDADSDGDSKPDCQDGCPFDAKRLEPGVCGCGASPEVDLNANGILDCLATAELRFTLSLAQSLMKKLSAADSLNKKKSAAQRRLRQELVQVSNEIQGIVSGGGVKLQNTTQSLDSLAQQATTAIRKALRAKGKSLGKSKNAALGALSSFLSGLAA